MKQAFLSTSFKNRNNINAEVEAIRRSAQASHLELLVFVDKYEFNKGEEKIMMQQTCEDIKNSAILLAEISDKAIGVGIEVGYAIALGIPVVYMRQNNSEYSNTIGGIVANHIVYADSGDLERQLTQTIKTLLSSL